jgi:integrase
MLGLGKRGKIWHIHKVVKCGSKQKVVRGSTGTTNQKIAQEIMDAMITEAREQMLYGKQGKWTVAQGCARYLVERKDKQIGDALLHTGIIGKYLGKIEMRYVHINHPNVRQLIEDRLGEGLKISTVNHTLKVLRKILNDSSKVWRDDDGLPWLGSPPLIKLLSEDDRRKPNATPDAAKGHALTRQEETELFSHLPDRLSIPIRFALHTGLRMSAIVQLRWEWEVAIPELGVSVFDIPPRHMGEDVRGTKNGEGHRIVLNSIALSAVEQARDDHTEFVFTRILNGVVAPYAIEEGLHTDAWKRAVRQSGLRECRGPRAHFRVHDLKHTFGSRLRAMDVDFEDRQDLLGHKNGSVTTLYSAAETNQLLSKAERVVEWYGVKPKLVVHASHTQTNVGAVYA